MGRLAVILFLVVAGCAGGNVYGRPGGTNEAFQQDAARCRMVMAGVQAPRSTPPLASYQGQSTTYGRSTTAVNSPTGSSVVAQNLSDTSDTLMTIAVRDRIYDDCLRAEGWVRQN